MRRFFDALGAPFIYRSPSPRQGYIHFLQLLPSSTLRKLAGTRSHLSKKQLVLRFLNDV